MEKKPASEGKSPVFGTASFVFAILTIVLPVVLMISFGQKADKADQSENPYKGFEVLGLVLVGLFFALIAAGVSSVFGTLTGVVALIRDERVAAHCRLDRERSGDCCYQLRCHLDADQFRLKLAIEVHESKKRKRSGRLSAPAGP